jgi:hypothetical protein
MTCQKGVSLSLMRRLIRHVSAYFERNDDHFAPSFDADWWRH